MFKFKEAIMKGQESAMFVIGNRKEVDGVFEMLNNELDSLTSDDLFISRNIKTVKKDESLDNEDLARDKAGRIMLHVGDKYKTIANWEQDKNGYPFTIINEDGRTDCWDKESLIFALSEILSAGRFWLWIEEMKRG
jgi:hypothetical protein